MRNIGMVLGVAIAGAVFSNRMNYFTKILSAQGLEGAASKSQAFAGALHVTFLVGAGLAVIGVFTSLVRGPLNDLNKAGSKF